MKRKVETEYRVYEGQELIGTYTKKKFATLLVKQGQDRYIKEVKVEVITF